MCSDVRLQLCILSIYGPPLNVNLFLIRLLSDSAGLHKNTGVNTLKKH